MNKNPVAFISLMICITALLFSIWAISFIDLQPEPVIGKSTSTGRVNITIPAVCGSGVCDVPFEDFNNCPADCTSYCGDAVCDPTENSTACCNDCDCPGGYTCLANACVATEPEISHAYIPSVGGTSPTSPSSGASFSLKPEILKVVLTNGQTVEKEFEVRNDGDFPLNLALRVIGLNSNLRLSSNELYLEPNAAVKVKAIFFAQEDHLTAIYTGKILIIAGNPLIKELPVILEIQSPKPLFDVEIFLPERFKKVYAGDVIEPQITIYGKTGHSDVHVYYKIKDSSDNVVLSEDEILTIRSQLTVTKKFLLPPELKPGSYVLSVKSEYMGTAGTASEVFTVVEKRVVLSANILIYLALVLSVVGIIIYSLSKKTKKK